MNIDLGDQVAYSAEFCRSIGACTGDIPLARGVVRNLMFIGGNIIARIDWGDPEVPDKVLVDNLIVVAKGKTCMRNA